MATSKPLSEQMFVPEGALGQRVSIPAGYERFTLRQLFEPGA